jgi:hypothetical protein
LISVGGRACNQDDVADILGLRLKRFPTRCTVGGTSRSGARRSRRRGARGDQEVRRGRGGRPELEAARAAFTIATTFLPVSFFF